MGMIQVQYFMTENKRNRTVNYTLCLEEDALVGNLFFASRKDPGDVWGPPSKMKDRKGSALVISETEADRMLQVEGFTFKEVS